MIGNLFPFWSYKSLRVTRVKPAFITRKLAHRCTLKGKHSLKDSEWNLQVEITREGFERATREWVRGCKKQIVKRNNKLMFRKKKSRGRAMPPTSRQLPKKRRWPLEYVGWNHCRRVAGSENLIKPKGRRGRHTPQQQPLPDRRSWCGSSRHWNRTKATWS